MGKNKNLSLTWSYSVTQLNSLGNPGEVVEEIKVNPFESTKQSKMLSL